jgi:hypothetical protein
MIKSAAEAMATEQCMRISARRHMIEWLSVTDRPDAVDTATLANES